MPVDIRTARLPKTLAEPPRLAINTRREGNILHVEPNLVYGDPPTARVVQDRLIPMGHEALPIRAPRAEERLRTAITTSPQIGSGKNAATHRRVRPLT